MPGCKKIGLQASNQLHVLVVMVYTWLKTHVVVKQIIHHGQGLAQV